MGEDPFKPKAFRGNYLELWDKVRRCLLSCLGFVGCCLVRGEAHAAPGIRIVPGLGAVHVLVGSTCVLAMHCCLAQCAPSSHHPHVPTEQVIREAHAADLLFDQFMMDRLVPKMLPAFRWLAIAAEIA